MTKARSPIPSEILDRCRVLKQQWTRTRRTNALQAGCEEEQVHHPRRPHLRATIHLKQLKLAGVARPHFLIQCEDLRRHAASGAAPGNSRLPHLSPTYEPRTGSCRACLRRAEQPGDRRKRPVECANGEKASSRGLPQTRSPQPQPAYDADALNRAAKSSTAHYPPLNRQKAPISVSKGHLSGDDQTHQNRMIAFSGERAAVTSDGLIAACRAHLEKNASTRLHRGYQLCFPDTSPAQFPV